jgi:hypothetical protein
MRLDMKVLVICSLDDEIFGELIVVWWYLSSADYVDLRLAGERYSLWLWGLLDRSERGMLRYAQCHGFLYRCVHEEHSLHRHEQKVLSSLDQT